MPAFTATHQRCDESWCIAGLKIKFVNCHAGGRTAGSHTREGGLPEQVGASSAEQVPRPPPCLLSLPPINVALNLGVWHISKQSL
jgi:hypothetical protein